jgi:hypothetical protein
MFDFDTVVVHERTSSHRSQIKQPRTIVRGLVTGAGLPAAIPSAGEGLTQGRPVRIRAPRLFCFSAPASKLARFKTKKPARLRLVGFVTPTGFKPVTY